MLNKSYFKYLVFFIINFIFFNFNNAKGENSDFLDNSISEYKIYLNLPLLKGMKFIIKSYDFNWLGIAQIDVQNDQLLFGDRQGHYLGAVKNNEKIKEGAVFNEEGVIIGKIKNAIDKEKFIEILNENDELLFKIQKSQIESNLIKTTSRIFNSEGEEVGFFKRTTPLRSLIPLNTIPYEYTLVLKQNQDEVDRRLLLGALLRYLTIIS